MVAAAVAFGLLIGTTLGMLGGGGSMLTVPIFVYVLGFGPKDAIAMSLAVVGATSIVGSVGHWRAGNVNLRVALPLAAVAMVGAVVGSRLARLIDGHTQLAIFGLVMLTAAVFMARGARRPGGGQTAAQPRARAVAPLALVGLVVGMLTGVVGVGGGFLIVPALVFVGVPMREAIGTSLSIIAANCVTGLFGYLGQAHFVWSAVALMTAFTLPGMAIGLYLHRYVPQHALRGAFAVFLVIVATFILYQNVGLS